MIYIQKCKHTKENTLEIHFIYLGSKEIYWIFKYVA